MGRETGTYEIVSVDGETVRAFVPRPLPPARPPLILDAATTNLLVDAEKGLARLDVAGRMVPSVDWFVYALVRKEAVISSQIEGTQASLADLLQVEADVRTDAPREHVEEICNYLDAVNYARSELRRTSGLPVSMRLINGAHERLLSGTRGHNRQPGQIRRTQNWIGGTRPGNARFVPPPASALAGLLSDLEHFLHARDDLPPLVRAGLIHAQFETIHPYLDGNGRVGRLLVALCLEAWQLLSEPLLYLSLHFKRHRREYYDRLDAVRLEGDWEGWTVFFLEGVAAIANEAAELIGALADLINLDRQRVLGSSSATIHSLRLFEQLPNHPIVTAKLAEALCDTTRPTAAKAINVLVEVGILEEASGKARDRSYRYREYLEQLRVGTELDD